MIGDDPAVEGNFQKLGTGLGGLHVVGVGGQVERAEFDGEQLGRRIVCNRKGGGAAHGHGHALHVVVLGQQGRGADWCKKEEEQTAG